MSYLLHGDTTNSSASNIAKELTKPFLYQNHVTNKASSTPISTKQLCRILCPMAAMTRTSQNNGVVTNSTTAAVVPTSRIPIQSDSTLLIGFDSETGEFCAEGWRIARTIPILREACCNWYYEGIQSDVDVATTGTEGRDSGDATKCTSNILGPISCRELSRLYNTNNNNNDTDGVTVDRVKDSTRVWSPEIAQQEQQKNGSNESPAENSWKPIAELHLLEIAMEAFVEAPMPWSFQNQTDDVKQEGVDGAPPATNLSSPANTQKQDQDAALEEFLSSTADNDGGEEEEEEYESDGGTTYAKDHRNGNWVHADLLPPDRKRKLADEKFNDVAPRRDDNTVQTSNLTTGHDKKGNKKKKKKSKFKSKNSKCWIYITNLPQDTTQEELTKYFSKAGIIDLDPETQKPKVKLYRYRHGDTIKNKKGQNHPAKAGQPKGDASICYARPESVELALQLLDDSNFRPLPPTGSGDGAHPIDAAGIVPTLSVQRAKFSQHGDQYHGTREVSNAKRKVARLAALQAIGWDEGDNGRITGGLKGLTIIVLKHMFTLEELQQASKTTAKSVADTDPDCNEDTEGEDAFLKKLEQGVLKECEQWGDVEKITAFSKNVDGIMVVKFTQPTAASKAIETYNGRVSQEHGNRKIEACYWDGATDFTVRDEVKEQVESEKRLDEFGDWLDKQELPDEFQLNVEE
mmetsp:Transcript_5671/g.6591  ORF Transcript_5671/g.6591 Transcript_5671/m.6591 type:complete len:689 (+) Transcript_5671:159-2225(+)